MSKRIVSVVFESGVINLGSKIKFGHFYEYAVVNIAPGVSELMGNVMEITTQSEEGRNGYFLIPVDRIEGLEYCMDEDIDAAVSNFKRFLDAREERRAPPGMGQMMPMDAAGPDLQQFIQSIALANGLNPDGSPVDQSNDEDDEDE